jgi:cytochrome b561
MQVRNSDRRYGAVAQLLHWTIVVLVITQFVLAEIAEDQPALSLEKLAVLARHKSVGMTILMLALIRLLWRWANPVPALPAGVPGWQARVARITHVALYTLIIAQPLSGWLMSSAKAYSVSWFGLFEFPNLVAKSESTFDAMHETHEVLATLLAVVAIVHAAAALKHHFYDRDDVLKRMLPARSRGRS